MINLTGRILYYLIAAAGFFGFILAYSVLHYYNAHFYFFLLMVLLNTVCAFGYGFFANDIKKDLSA